MLAEAACRGAVYNVRINVASMSDKAAGAGLLSAAAELVASTARDAAAATAAVEKQIG